MAIKLKTPLDSAAARALRAGDMCLLTGELYTARDAAHKRLCTLLEAGQPLPFDMRGAVIYFVGPTPAKPGQAIGSAGPTTSYRMDAYSPALLRQGLTGMIGKGPDYFRFVQIGNGSCNFQNSVIRSRGKSKTFKSVLERLFSLFINYADLFKLLCVNFCVAGCFTALKSFTLNFSCSVCSLFDVG